MIVTGCFNCSHREVECADTGHDSYNSAHCPSRFAVSSEPADVTLALAASSSPFTSQRSTHLAANIEFAKAVRSERSVVSYTRQANVAWLVSTSTATGTFDGRDINSAGAELMILTRAQKIWQIRAVHWSSQRRQAR